MREWVTDFLASLALTPNVSEACRQAGVTRKAAYDLRKADPEFAALWDDALDESTDELVGECYRRAKQGTEEPVYYLGKEIGRVKKYSDTLAIFLLKAHRRGVYGDKVDQLHAGDVTIRVEYEDVPDPDGEAPEAPPGPAAVPP